MMSPADALKMAAKLEVLEAEMVASQSDLKRVAAKMGTIAAELAGIREKLL